jgi:hypothetical protein
MSPAPRDGIGALREVHRKTDDQRAAQSTEDSGLLAPGATPSEQGDPMPGDREPPREPDFDEDEPFHPLALCLGILMVLLLVLGAWFIFKGARCNPLYSDSGLFRSQSCR